MADTMIKVNNVTKSFVIPNERQNTLKSKFVNPFKKVKKDTFNALKDIDFKITTGEFVGIIGRNGSGKSTLLKLIAGVYEPTEGGIEVNGNLVPFLELGVGFNPELTGRENVYLNGAILGMTHDFMDEKMDEIIEFAELEKFIDMQTKNYSSGMMMRLAFSVAAQVKADIYLLDEVLGVGDAGFQKKSLAKMKELLSGGSTVLYVSHNAASIKEHCDRVIYLQNGHKIFDGDTDKGLVHYELSFLESEEEKKKYLKNNRAKEVDSVFMKNKKALDKDLKGKSEIEKIFTYEKYKLELLTVKDGDLYNVQMKKVKQLKDALSREKQGEGLLHKTVVNTAELINLKLKNKQGLDSQSFEVGEAFEAEVIFKVGKEIERPVILLGFTKENVLLQAVNTPRKQDKIIPHLKKGDVVTVSFIGKMQLNPGIFDVRLHFGNPAIHNGGTGELVYVDQKASSIQIHSTDIPDPKTWSFKNNPVDHSGLVQNKFNYKVDVKHE